MEIFKGCIEEGEICYFFKSFYLKQLSVGIPYAAKAKFTLKHIIGNYFYVGKVRIAGYGQAINLNIFLYKSMMFQIKKYL